MQGSFYKLNQNILGTWDPALEPTYSFTANIMQARGDALVIAAILTALLGQVKIWFRSLRTELYGREMNTVKGWAELLEKAFPVDRIKTRKEAKSRHYVPIKNGSVMEYVWDKMELLRAANRSMEEDLVEEIWMGFPDQIRLIFDNEEDILDCPEIDKRPHPQRSCLSSNLKKRSGKEEGAIV